MDQERHPDEGLSTAQAWVLGLLAGLVVLALMGVAYTIGSNRGEDEAAPQPARTAEPKPGEEAQPPAHAEGEQLFVSNCGSCHTLGAAGTSGAAGPDLDSLGPDPAQVLSAIENGGAGSGAMPAGLLEGEEAQQVADYVGGAAGD
jgi:cytochrome c551